MNSHSVLSPNLMPESKPVAKVQPEDPKSAKTLQSPEETGSSEFKQAMDNTEDTAEEVSPVKSGETQTAEVAPEAQEKASFSPLLSEELINPLQETIAEYKPEESATEILVSAQLPREAYITSENIHVEIDTSISDVGISSDEDIPLTAIPVNNMDLKSAATLDNAELSQSKLTTEANIKANQQLLNNNLPNTRIQASLLANDSGQDASLEALIQKSELAAASKTDLLVADKPSNLITQQAVPVANTTNEQTTLVNNTRQLTITTPFNKTDWGNIVADKIVWMSGKGIKEAVIQMDPPELGPINVKISVVQEQTQVSFTVSNPTVKDALDQSAMRLREMFAEEGLNLANVDVSDQSQGDNNGSEESESGQSRSGSTELEDETTTVVSQQSSLYLVDSYV